LLTGLPQEAGEAQRPERVVADAQHVFAVGRPEGLDAHADNYALPRQTVPRLPAARRWGVRHVAFLDFRLPIAFNRMWATVCGRSLPSRPPPPRRRRGRREQFETAGFQHLTAPRANKSESD
jgi:hypothetical protein